MRHRATGKSHRTPIKHFVLDKSLGRIVGALSTRSPDIPATLPLHVVDMCAGDGVSEPGLTCSPEIIHKHINFARLNGEARATLFEVAEDTFRSLQENWGNRANMTLVHGSSRGIVWKPSVRDQALFAHIDPNSLKDWPVTPEFAGSMTRSTTFLATLGCNVGGLKRLGFDEHRHEWYDHVRHLLVVPPWHDVQLYVLNRDAAQWAYLLRVPSAWADDTAKSIIKYGDTHWPHGLSFASAKQSPMSFKELTDKLFLTRKERSLAPA